VLAAILAAAMSSIDSALNSLAAVTLEDVVGRPAERQHVWLARGTTLAWGLFAVVSGMAFARAGTGVIELVNMIGSAFYGPVLAVFVLAVLGPGVGGRGALTGLAAGLAANLLVARMAPGISWMWWNPIGFITAAAAALLVSGARLAASALAWPRTDGRLLLAAFMAMFATLLLLPRAIEWAQ
jgi:SSS family solute:Na+ symporter